MHPVLCNAELDGRCSWHTKHAHHEPMVADLEGDGPLWLPVSTAVVDRRVEQRLRLGDVGIKDVQLALLVAARRGNRRFCFCLPSCHSTGDKCSLPSNCYQGCLLSGDPVVDGAESMRARGAYLRDCRAIGVLCHLLPLDLPVGGINYQVHRSIPIVQKGLEVLQDTVCVQCVAPWSSCARQLQAGELSHQCGRCM